MQMAKAAPVHNPDAIQSRLSKQASPAMDDMYVERIFDAPKKEMETTKFKSKDIVKQEIDIIYLSRRALGFQRDFPA
jgi:hypothetical protein